MPRIIVLFIGLLALLVGIPHASAQQLAGTQVVTSCGGVSPFPTIHAGSRSTIYVDPNGEMCISGSFSASLNGFTPTPSYATLTASDALNHSVATPTGTDEVITNKDTNIAYCNFGAASTTSTFPIIAGQAIGVHFGGSASTIQCQSPSSSLSITIAGGAGLFTGAGGGGGGGGSGGNPDTNLSFTGAISAANNFSTGMVVGNYMSTQGLVGYSSGGPELTGTCTANSCMSTSGFAGWNSIYLECTGGGAAGTNWFEVDTSGQTGGTLQKRQATFTGPTFSGLINVAGATFLNVMADQYASGTLSCDARATQNFAQPNGGNGPIRGNFNSIFTASSAATARVITGVPGLSVVVTAIQSWTDGSAAAPGSVQVVAGTGTNCATNKVNLSEAMNFPAGNGLVTATSGQFVTAPPGDDVCITTTGTNAVNGSLTTALR